MSLELLDPESEQLYVKLKSVVMEHAEKVGLTFDALVRIRDGKLYRSEFKTFEAFCESTGMNTRKAYRIMEGGYGKGKPKRLKAPKPVIEVKPEAVKPTEPGPCTPEEAPEWPDVIGASPADAASATEKVAAMMERLSLKPVIDIRAEQYRTHSPIPPMDRPEECALTPPESLNLSAPAQVVLHEGTWMLSIPEMNREIAAHVVKAWAGKRRAMNDATSEEDAAWACYIAQQILS